MNPHLYGTRILRTNTQKLGKRAPRRDRRTFKLSKYLMPRLPQPPSEVSWVTKVPNWPMYLNDQLGDCVIAAEAHMINQWSQYATGAEVLPTDQDVLTVYERVGGYVPGDPATDNGCDMLTALQDFKSNGLAGHEILAYMAVDQNNLTEIFQAIMLFGQLFTGIQLPISAQGMNAWTVPAGGPYGDGSPGSWGGHCIPIDAASPATFTCVTWGQRLKMSRNFFWDYVDECYVVLSKDWIAANGLSPSQFNLAQLQADLAAL
jgi:hypothetical protein